MPITASNKGGTDFEPVPAGIHDAICYGVYDIGSHYSKNYGKLQRKVIIMWELPNERIEIDGVDKPRAINKWYTLSLSDLAHLRKDLESWRGVPFTEAELQGFDIAKLIGVPCQLQVMHNKTSTKTYANITTVIPWSKDKPKPQVENDRQYYSLDDDIPIPGNCPEWVAKMINESYEKKEEVASRELEANPKDTGLDDFGEGDDIPF
jgi:hypothetical protein